MEEGLWAERRRLNEITHGRCYKSTGQLRTSRRVQIMKSSIWWLYSDSSSKKGKFCHLFILMLFQTCLTFIFSLWHFCIFPWQDSRDGGWERESSTRQKSNMFEMTQEQINMSKWQNFNFWVINSDIFLDISSFCCFLSGIFCPPVLFCIKGHKVTIEWFSFQTLVKEPHQHRYS